MTSNIRIKVDVPVHESVESLKNFVTLEKISQKVMCELEKQGKEAQSNAIIRACKNAMSLFRSRKKNCPPGVLSVYVPQSALKPIRDNVVPINSSDDDTSRISRSSSDEVTSNGTDSDQEPSSSVQPTPSISFSLKNNDLEAVANFEYLFNYFKHTLSRNVKPMNVDKMIDDICDYSFTRLHHAVHVKAIRRETYRQLSYIVQSARTVESKTCIKALRARKQFSFVFKSLCPLGLAQSSSEFNEFRGENSSKPMLLIRDNCDRQDIIQVHPISGGFEITVSESWIQRILALFDAMRILDVGELSDIIFQHCSHIDPNLDRDRISETLKTEILHIRTTNIGHRYLTITLKSIDRTEIRNKTDDLDCISQDTLDAIIGRTYVTRGIKHSYVEDSIPVESKRKKSRDIQLMEQKRDLLYLKDTYHLTDSAFNAIFQYIQGKNKFFSLGEIERLRKKTNEKFPIISTKSSAFVKFAFAVRTAIFVAQKYEPHLDRHDKLNIRFNMDGTLIGNKHIVAISINCIEGGLACQSPKNLVPLALFEVQKENTTILRKSLPGEFISDIKNLRHISMGKKDVEIHLRLGGDLMNAVYVFGLSGFSSNHPCVFCTQHKDDLHVTEQTEYDKVTTEGKGKNKKKVTVRIGASSCHDVTKKARSLVQQTSSLLKGTNDLGYKSEPLFGDLFEYKDYCVDTLHMKLRVFDVLLKDILSYASRTDKYGAEHLSILERKIEILNKHCENTVGKRFFFQIDSDEKSKTISSHGKLSGHLQDLFFVDSFPYEEILDKDFAKSARTVVNKFKEILKELRSGPMRDKKDLKRLSLEFVKEFRQSGLRTTVTPYIHIIGNHLFEFDEMTDLRDYNMQGVEKSNDLLSRLYFSSTNPARNPLLTMLQKLYRMLEMNFESEKERETMKRFAETDVYEFVEDFQIDDHDDMTIFNQNKDHERDTQSSMHDSNSEEESELSNESMTWSPEKRIKSPLFPRSTNRFKSFRRS